MHFLETSPTGDVAVFKHTPKLEVLVAKGTAISGKYRGKFVTTSMQF